MLSCLIVLVLLCQKIEGYYPLAKRMEVDRIEPFCPEWDNCNYSQTEAMLESCACDVDCNKFEDCCIDAPKFNSVKSEMKCYHVKGLGGVYMIGKCPATYHDDEGWRERCETVEIADPSDPIGSVPVTDPDTGVTYKNVYCQFCNGKNSTRFWQMRMDCPFTDEYFIEEEFEPINLEWEYGTWSLNLQAEDGIYSLECNIEKVTQPKIRSKIRQCHPKLISDCPSTWENEAIRKKCKSFQGARYTDDGVGYRNMYCAICNAVNASQLSCYAPQSETTKLFKSLFIVLWNVTLNEGEILGKITIKRVRRFLSCDFDSD